MHRIPTLTLVIAALVVPPSSAAEPSKDGLAFYEQKVQPVLAAHCYKCHSHAAGKDKGGLVVDSLASMLTGGDSGPSVVPGDPAKSLLITASLHTNEDLKMPPDKKMPPADIEVLTTWVKMGAPAPASKPGRVKGKITDEDRAWWAFQPVKPQLVPTPASAGWAKNEIDRFILAKLEQEKLRPSPEADRRTLIRRLYFDLVGLPPSTVEVEAFVADPSQDAYAKLVEKLLASPHYGEHWARHWLDLARYAESDGFRLDEYRPTAWRYREYVIKSFNDDKPYDRFIREQIAGDELDPDNPEALAATAFLRHTMYEYNQRDVRTQWSDFLNDLTDTTGEVFLGLGFGCARCHDHKFDPILQKDYYRLQAFFVPYLPIDDVVLATPTQKAEFAAKQAKWEAATAEIRAKIDVLEAPYKKKVAHAAIIKFTEDLQAMILKPAEKRTALEHQLAELAYRQVTYEFGRMEKGMKDEHKSELAALKRALAEFDSIKPAPLPTGLSVTDAKPIAPPMTIPKKADQTPIEPGILTLLDEKPMAIPARSSASTTGRRSALAHWIAQPGNSLTTRVIVNRLWQYHFGRGIVATSSDFGRLGEKPSHPELLDWLATRFVQDGWSMKSMHRLILNSATYKQAAIVPESKSANLIDPENRLLWRGFTRRLDAEQIRDAILFATGDLDLTTGGPSVDFTKPRRTVYTRATRNTRDGLLDVFDLPEGFTSTAQRNVTTTPTQALLLFNAQSFIQRAKAMASRLAKEAKSDEDRVKLAYRLAYGREATSSEVSHALSFLVEQTQRINPKTGGQAGFYSEKMPYREGRAALLQPGGQQNRLVAGPMKEFPAESFTIEGFVLLRSLYETGQVRVIASQWSGGSSKVTDRAGWSFGVTSRKSAYKPQTLVLQLWDGNGGYEPLFSGLHIALNKPYFVAVTVNIKDTSEKGIVFYAKDLSNDDEPMQSNDVEHKLKSLGEPKARFAIGGFESDKAPTWDGLIDDVRVSKAALRNEQLLLTREGVQDHTVGFWPFERRPSPYHDATGHGHDIQIEGSKEAGPTSPSMAALIDFCHALLNSNEFLYVD